MYGNMPVHINGSAVVCINDGTVLEILHRHSLSVSFLDLYDNHSGSSFCLTHLCVAPDRE